MNEDGCIICGEDTKGFTTCVECVVKVYIDRGQCNGGEDTMAYLREHNRKRFDMLIAKYAPTKGKK